MDTALDTKVAQRVSRQKQPIAAFALAVLAAGGIAALYLLKSALGINIFPGHAPLLHAILYPLVHG